MSVTIEDRRTGQTRLIDTTPPKFRPRPLIKPDQSSIQKEPIRKSQDIFFTRDYTTDGCNKVEKVKWGRLIGKTRLELPHPCWKAICKRRHQWKRQLRGYASARVLNDMGKCIYPNTTC